ncbi:MAG: GAP family protein [Chloroflexi bacterium]|nr:GAP family protein [Chloroflexota bacterium]MBP7044546.1 GAP family protein [Chloroflexota bacterium]
MDYVLVNLLPVMVGATIVPLYPVVTLLLLQSEDGLRKAIAFISGGVAMRLAQGVLFGLVFSAAMDANPEGGRKLIASTLLLVVGVLLLVTAVKTWRKEEDPDAPSPKWMSNISGLTALRAMGMGVFFITIDAKQWVFTLSAISIISEGGLGLSTGLGLYLFYILVTQMLMLLPVLGRAIAPRQVARPLKAGQVWLERNSRVIIISVSLLFGLLFSYKAMIGLLG